MDAFLHAGAGAWACLVVFLGLIGFFLWITWTTPKGPRS